MFSAGQLYDEFFETYDPRLLLDFSSERGRSRVCVCRVDRKFRSGCRKARAFVLVSDENPCRRVVRSCDVLVKDTRVVLLLPCRPLHIRSVSCIESLSQSWYTSLLLREPQQRSDFTQYHADGRDQSLLQRQWARKLCRPRTGAMNRDACHGTSMSRVHSRDCHDQISHPSWRTLLEIFGGRGAAGVHPLGLQGSDSTVPRHNAQSAPEKVSHPPAVRTPGFRVSTFCRMVTTRFTTPPRVPLHYRHYCIFSYS